MIKTKDQKITIEISRRTIFFLLLLVGVLWFTFLIREIILQLLVATLLVFIFNPTVVKMARYKIPRALAVAIVYIFFIGLLIFALASVIPALIEQSTNFANSLPKYLDELNIPEFISEGVAREITSALGILPSHVLRIGVSVFSNALNVLAVLMFAFYLLLSRDKIYEKIGEIFEESKSKKIEKILTEVETRLSSWARGQLILMIMVGLANYVGLTILGVPFAVPLALLHGLLEIIPNIGPFLGAIPSVIVGFGISPVTGLAVTALAFLIQQIENYVFVPNIMKKSVGLSPIVTLLSLLIGFKIAGVAGIILSIPTVITFQVITKELVIPRKI